MIIFDFSQLFLSCVFTQPADLYETEDNYKLVRHLVLNHFASIKMKFQRENSGNIVFACDGQNYWRKQYFPYYKASRKLVREESSYNFTNIFKFMNLIKSEFKENFPYMMLEVYEAEADDIIGVLAEYRYKYETVIVVSSDKDFKQLLKYHSIKQYDPYKRVLIKEPNPVQFLEELIIRGDVSDGIPNILSPDDSFVNKIRQKPITKKFLNESSGALIQHFDHYLRNKTLIDFSEIPLYVQQNIIKAYDAYEILPTSTIYSYFVKNSLTNLMSRIEDFTH